MSLSIILFSLILSLLFVHEMDAIRNAEWKMFVVLKDIEDSKAYKIFTFLHLPLYAALFVLLSSSYQIIVFYFIDLFLIVHTVLHLIFDKHKNKGLKTLFQEALFTKWAYLRLFI